MSYFSSIFSVFVFLLLSAWPNPLPAQDAEMPTQRWAVIAVDTNSQSLADLLTVELTALNHVELVEREQIRIVLEELALNASGLVDPDRSLQFGQLSQADALVIVDAPADQNARRQDLRVRLIDTRTSIRLWDTLLPRHNIDDEVSAIVTELRTASKVLSIPPEQIRAIGMTRIVSGEAGHLLSPYCRTLEALLAAELFRVPEVVVLERSDLQRLTTESRLSGIQLQLRAATRLLEISVRRSADAKGIIASCRISTPSGGESVTADIPLTSREAIHARKPLADWTIENLAVQSKLRQSVSPEEEAAVFERRASWARAEDAVAMAEAALALAPNQQRFFAAVNLRFRLAGDHRRAKENLEALIAYRDGAELRLQYLDSYRHEFQESSFRPLYYTFGSPYLANTEEEKQLLIECSDLEKRIRYAEYEHVAGEPLARLISLMRRIDVELRWTPSTPNAANQVSELLQEAFRLRKAAGVPQELQNPYYNEMIRTLMVAIERVHSDTMNSTGHLQTDDFDRWASDLLGLDGTFTHAAILRTRSFRSGASGQQAASELAVYLHQLPLVDTKHVDAPLRRAALSKISSEELFAFFQRMLDQSESLSNPEQVLVLNSEISDLLKRLSTDQASTVARRMIGLLKLEHEANTMFSTTSILATLSKFVPKQESPFRPLPEFNLTDVPMPWQSYRTVPIKLRGQGRLPRAIAIDATPNTNPRKIYLAWTASDNSASIERVGLDSGAAEPFGPTIQGFSRYGRLKMAIGNDVVFLIGTRPGLTMVTDKAVKYLTETDGAASNQIKGIAWCRDRLFIAYDAAFGSYDPKTERFELYASSTSVTALNPLDTQGYFQIRQVLAEQDAVWLSVFDRRDSANRTGVWRCEPWSNKYEKVTSYSGELTLADDGILLHSTMQPAPSWIDRNSLTVTILPEFSAAVASNRHDQPSFVSPHVGSYTLDGSFPKTRLIKIGEHLVSSNCRMITADGQSHSLDCIPFYERWLSLQRFGRGFLAHYDSSRQTLWYVEPK